MQNLWFVSCCCDGSSLCKQYVLLQSIELQLGAWCSHPHCTAMQLTHPSRSAVSRPNADYRTTPRRPAAVASSSSPSGSSVRHTSSTVYEALLDWADAADMAQRPVAVEQHPDFGRCLVATKDIPNGTVLLSVPLEQVFQSQLSYEYLELHWAAEMALRLLQARHASNTTTTTTSSSSTPPDASSPAFWGPWVKSLPQQVVTPVEFTTQEVQQLVVPSTVQAVMDARESLEGCFEVLQPDLAAIGATWADFLWAVQVLHSRCFFEATAGRHMAVPGVDMCNHSYQPNATVRLVHSPAACQGLDALEEVAPVAAAAACPSFFQLVADTSMRKMMAQQARHTSSSDALRMLMRPDSIQAGDQVTISYGPWPTEPLLLLFGFVPQHNPHDALVLFSDLQHMAECWLDMVSSSSSSSGGDVAGSPAAAAGVAADPAFAEMLQQQLSAAEVSAGLPLLLLLEQQQQAHGRPGFRDLGLSAASAADARLRAGLQVLQRAVEAAVQQRCDASKQQQQQLVSSVPGVVRYRLQQLAQQLEASAVAHGSSSGGGQEQTEVVEASISYSTSAEHRSLIAAYCSSKAQLARHLLQRL